MKRTVAAILLLMMTLSLFPCASAFADAASAAEAAALFDSGDYTGAFQKASAADSTDPAVAALLGKAYYLGLGTDVNYSKYFFVIHMRMRILFTWFPMCCPPSMRNANI